MFADKILLITGGTGSFGNAVLRRFLDSDLREIRIFSRDEKKQDDMRKKYNNPKLKFYIGDVRDPQSVMNAVRGVDHIYHAAALKQVPSCEFYPIEAVKTNVLGTENVLNAAIARNVEKVVCLSTDKAVYPINAMGISKAMMEKVMVAKSRISGKTILVGTRYGNVMASRGSVIPLFFEQINNNEPITVTDSNMTRFMMTLDDAVELVLYAFENGNSGDIFVQKSPASTIGEPRKPFAPRIATLGIPKTPNYIEYFIWTLSQRKLSLSTSTPNLIVTVHFCRVIILQSGIIIVNYYWNIWYLDFKYLYCYFIFMKRRQIFQHLGRLFLSL